MKSTKPKSTKTLQSVTNQDDAVFEFLKNKSRDLSSQKIHWMLILASLLLVFRPLPYKLLEDVMLYMATSVVIIMLIMILVALNSIPNIFFSLWSRKIISVGNSPHGFRTEKTDEAQPSILVNQFKYSVENLVKISGHPFQYVLGFIFSLLAMSRTLYQMSGGMQHIGSVLFFLKQRTFLGILQEFWPFLYIDMFVGFVVGIAAWKIIAASLWIWRLSKYFKINLILGHPDKSAGLAPIGNFCLLNALIVAVPMSYLSGWLLVLSQHAQYRHWQNFFIVLLGLGILVSTLIFFLPLWSTHQVMMKNRNVIQKQLDEISISIAEINSNLLNNADSITPDLAEQLLEKRKILMQIYEQSSAIPVWPLNLSAVIKFLGSQLLPVIAIIKSIVDIVA